MTKVIHKVPLNISQGQSISLPEGAKCMKAAPQDGLLYIWYISDTENIAKYTSVRCDVVMTGPEYFQEADMVHLDTILLDQGTFVVHVFVPKNSRA